MTFGNLILNLRKRLQDFRKRDGSLISVASEDGVRWTSSELVDIWNEAFEEFLRYASMISVNIDNKGAINRLINSRLLLSDNALSGDVQIASTGIYLVTHVTREEYPSSYEYYTPQKYAERLAEAGDSDVNEERPIFTYEKYDDSNFTLRTTPETAVPSGITYHYLPVMKYDIGDIAVSVPLDNCFYDVVFDIAERVARDRNNEWGKSAQLDRRIVSKLGVQNVGENNAQ
jgi:hypothetical protein